MKIADIQGRYYHGTRKYFRIGQKLVAQPDGYAQGESNMTAQERRGHLRVEQAIEQYRPAGAVSRFEAVYMIMGDDLKDVMNKIDMAGGYLDFVYEVEPAQPITKCNLAWHTELSEGSLMNGHALRNKKWVEQCATNYWNAVPHNGENFRLSPEWLTPSAIVKRLVHEDR